MVAKEGILYTVMKLLDCRVKSVLHIQKEQKWRNRPFRGISLIKVGYHVHIGGVLIEESRILIDS